MRAIILVALFACVAVTLAAPVGNTKQELEKDAARLKKEAHDVIAKLKAEGKHELAVGVQALEKEVEVIEKKVHDSHPETEVGKIALHAAESILKGLEEKLKAEIKKLGGTFFEDTKKQLGDDAAKLKKEAQDVIAKLKAEGKHELAAGIQFIETEIEKLDAYVHKQDPKTEVGKIALHAAEVILKGLEDKLKAEIKKLGGSFFEDVKKQLGDDAAKLRKEAQDVIAKLKAEGKHELAAGIQFIETEIEKLDAWVHKQDPKTSVGKIALEAAETILKGLEDKLKAEIKKLGGSFFEDVKKQLGDDAAKLRKEAQDVIAKLKAEGKHELAAGIQFIETEIEKLDAYVHKQDPKTEVGKIALHAAEVILKNLEDKLKAEIKKLGGQ